MKNCIYIVFCLLKIINYSACLECCNGAFQLGEIEKQNHISKYKEKGNGESLELLGKGHNGAAYKINDKYCLKVIDYKKYNLEQKIIEEKISCFNKNKVKNKPQEEITISDIENENNGTLNVDIFTNEISISIYLKSIFDKKEKNNVNIYKIYDVFSDKDNYYIISDLAQGNTLEKEINNHRYLSGNELKEALILNDFKIICQGIQFLHDNNIAHMDLKSDNIMFKETDNKTPYIIDLGTAMLFQDEQNFEVINEDKGDYSYKSKEIKGAIRNYSYDIAKSISKNKSYNPKQYDVWCLGLILYHMVFGKELFHIFSFNNIINATFSFGKKKRYIKNVLKDRENFDITQDKNITKLQNPKDCIFYELLTKILTKLDKDRMSLGDIIKEIENFQKIKLNIV